MARKATEVNLSPAGHIRINDELSTFMAMALRRAGIQAREKAQLNHLDDEMDDNLSLAEQLEGDREHDRRRRRDDGGLMSPEQR